MVKKEESQLNSLETLVVGMEVPANFQIIFIFIIIIFFFTSLEYLIISPNHQNTFWKLKTVLDTPLTYVQLKKIFDRTIWSYMRSFHQNKIAS